MFNSRKRVPGKVFFQPLAEEICGLNWDGTGDITAWIWNGNFLLFKKHLSLPRLEQPFVFNIAAGKKKNCWQVSWAQSGDPRCPKKHHKERTQMILWQIVRRTVLVWHHYLMI